MELRNLHLGSKSYHQCISPNYLPEMAEVFDDIKAKLGTSEEKEAILERILNARIFPSTMA